MPLTIARHCVPPSPNDPKLSPLQHALLHEPRRVRIADAPTGAGKSYAFQYAMANRAENGEGKRVLFIVPTRRLAQNLAASLVRNLVENEGWPAAKAAGKVALWSSDATARLKEQGVANINGHRVRQLAELDITEAGGEMIVAIPEVVSHLLLRRRMEKGQSAITALDLLADFEHIVFDEFHSIDPRGFGLAAVCAKLAAGCEWSRAKLSFLSATPLDIQSALEKLGVDPAQIAALHETVGEEGRPLHGDVELAFSAAASLAELVDEHKTRVAGEVQAGRQVVVIYDKLGDLRRELSALRETFDGLGIAPAQVLAVNSIDDSGGAGLTGGGFTAGRGQNPDDFAILVATASVEMGMTFRAANLLFMEPGFEPLNFLQRYGRAARRGEPGQVWVRCDAGMAGSKPWLRELVDWAQARDGQRVGIAELTALLCRAKQTEFKTPLGDSARHFGALPSRAVYTAGLYWNALLQHRSVSGPRKEQLLALRPDSAKAVYAWLKAVREMEKDRLFGAAAKHWCDRFEALAYTLRDIGGRLRFIESDGLVRTAPLLWLERETNILNRFLTHKGPDGKDEIRLPGSLDDYLLDEKNRVRPMLKVFFPNTCYTEDLRKDKELIDTWCRKLKKRDGQEGMAWELYPQAMQAAEKLVRTTGLVVSDDEFFQWL